ncbi:hypothetical protein [Aliarcobacter butzleri]|uniref:hypothetical protein n=1 Tax=Aliarcobacter butzleri TaxID=28197 RepID=UPI002B2509BD|nr:hypothetical protein [Aliarcobacter butzleri]
MNTINLNNKKSRKFLALVKNTIDDLLQIESSPIGILEQLQNIVNTKTLTLLNVQGLFRIIETRKEQMNCIKLIQDSYSFNLINEEHIYMENFISQYFNFQNLDGDSFYSISLK